MACSADARPLPPCSQRRAGDLHLAPGRRAAARGRRARRSWARPLSSRSVGFGMSVVRALLALLVLAGCVAGSVLFVSRAVHALGESPGQLGDRGSDAPASAWHPYDTTAPALPGASASDDSEGDDRDLFGDTARRVLLVAGLEIAGGVLASSARCWPGCGAGGRGCASAASTRCTSCTCRRTTRPRRRTSRTWSRRSRTSCAPGPPSAPRDGQPYVAVELICGAGDVGRWSGRSTCAASPRSPRRWTPRSAPPTPTCGSAAATPNGPSRARARCASPGTCCAFARSARSSTRSSPPTRRSRRRRWSRSRAPRSRSASRRSCAFSSPPPRRSSRSSRAGCTAATRTGSCARSAGGCRRAA